MTEEQWQSAWKLYQSGSSLPPGQILSFLNGVSADPEVRDAVLAMFEGPKKVDTLDRIGQKIGRYLLTGRLGEGGMGEVFAARDSELGRLVAVKLLAQSPAGKGTPVDRFIHEAKAASALNHPNIITIYEVIHSSSRLAIVMELVDGTSLRQLCGTPMPLDRVLHLGAQAARALSAAHARGIIHCDIKPENLMVRVDGLLKVLDFGLARDLATIGSSTVLPAGTLRYLPPEQSLGGAPSSASDVFSLGIVLYELAAGAHPFESGSIFDTLSRINQAEPAAPSSLNGFLPEHFDSLILAMLAKDPGQRPSAAEVAQLLESGFRSNEAPLARVGGSSKKKERKSHRKLAWITAAMLFAGVLAVLLWAPWRTPPPPGQSLRVDLDLGADVSLTSSAGPAVILSPDGTRMVFVSQGPDGVSQLLTRRLDQAKAVQLKGTEGAYGPFFSPDGQWVGFFAQAKLKKVRIDGGDPVSLCEAPSGRGASWGDDDTIIAALDVSAGLSRIPSSGGNPVAVTRLNMEAGENTHRWPQVLPGAQAVLFSSSLAYANWNDAPILVMSLRDHKTKTVLQHGGLYPRYLPSGHLIYVTNRTLFAARFDLNRLELRGAPTPLGEVASDSNYGFAQIDFSRNGTLAYRTGGTQDLRSFEWLDSTGKTVPFATEPGFYMLPRLSPDGSHLAYIQNQGSSTDLWVYDIERNINTRLTKGQSSYNAVWSADSRFLVFQAPDSLFWTRADGAGKPQPLTLGKAVQSPSSFSPDGALLAYSEQSPAGGAEIRTVAVENRDGQMHAGEPKTFLKTAAVLSFPSFSPDGHWLAYADAEGGRYEVYVRAFPDNGTKVQISNAGGIMPLWSMRDQEIFYRTADQKIMKASYKVRAGVFMPGKPQIWFGKQLANIGLSTNFDLAPDGKRFVVLLPVETPEPKISQSHVMLATNFFDEILRRLAERTK